MNTYFDSKILIVDDDYDYRSTLAEYFIDKNYNVLSAENGEKALKLIEHNHFDLVLLDLDMPIMNGLETMEAIHKISPETNLIIITGKANPAKYYYYKNGCIFFEKKPVDIIELEYKIKNIFRIIKKINRKFIPETTNIELDINTIYELILDNISNFNLNADLIADYFKINKNQLYSRVGEVLTISVHEMIKNIRLLKAYELVNKGSVRTIKELSNSVGYSDAGYFTKLYKGGFNSDLRHELSKRSKSIIRRH